MLTSKEIRQQFIDFFVSKQHTSVASDTVIPKDDPTLLFTNAGMNQFKNIFLGEIEPKNLRVVDVQKCIRAGGKHNDLDEVGRDGYHHTFFEMLGNWSFGDYYKKEAITWAWELITEVWKLPKEKLYATVHESDKEAFDLWKNETDINPAHIFYDGDKDNFWEMGDTGPCGPCSEIHFDRGIDYCGVEGKHDCRVNGDCHRFIELWNLVFMQYFRNKDGSLTPLKMKNVDTGAGLERICQVLQDKNSNYDTDLFIPLINKIAELTGSDYDREDNGVPHRVIADHIRALSFSIADGGIPSNEGRGYVIRRILRRAARMGRLLNQSKPFLYKLVPTVIEIMGHHYTELKEQQKYVEMIIKSEEERFNLTLDKGLIKFDEMLDKTSGKILSGEDAFMLYDTYGFPLDLTVIIAEEKGLTVDTKGFEEFMEEQKERARSASSFKVELDNRDWNVLADDAPTEFIGYNLSQAKASIIKYRIDDDNKVMFVLDKTPFYAESGGQIADTGKVFNDSFEIEVNEVRKSGDQFIHIGNLISGYINSNVVIASIDIDRRKRIASNHTATHLLHAALRRVLGDHVQQKGSLVTDEYLRFDFTHFKNMDNVEIKKVEELVRSEIKKQLIIDTKIMSQEEAKADGATALFGEKYGDKVRVVSLSTFSKELCGGTHVSNSAEIGMFKILSESSSSAGIRRIEAITREAVYKYYEEKETILDEVASILKAKHEKVVDKIYHIIELNRELENELRTIKSQAAGSEIDDLLSSAVIINGIKVASGRVSIDDSNELRNAGDVLRQKLGSGIGILISIINSKVSLLTVVTDDLKKQYPAGKIVGKLAEYVDGKGGGRPDMAMAGGKSIDKITEALNNVETIIKSF